MCFLLCKCNNFILISLTFLNSGWLELQESGFASLVQERQQVFVEPLFGELQVVSLCGQEH